MKRKTGNAHCGFNVEDKEVEYQIFLAIMEKQQFSVKEKIELRSFENNSQSVGGYLYHQLDQFTIDVGEKMDYIGRRNVYCTNWSEYFAFEKNNHIGYLSTRYLGDILAFEKPKILPDYFELSKHLVTELKLVAYLNGKSFFMGCEYSHRLENFIDYLNEEYGFYKNKLQNLKEYGIGRYDLDFNMK